jgi:hypothetical protein
MNDSTSAANECELSTRMKPQLIDYWTAMPRFIDQKRALYRVDWSRG